MLSIQNVSFGYDQNIVIKNLNFDIEQGENLAIIGESGCGKSTLLKLIFGLYDANEGEIWWDSEQILGPKFNLIPGSIKMKFLAQDFDLMPYITVAENVGRHISNTNLEFKNNRVIDLLSMVEMNDFANTKVQYLSGGQLQRVALASVLAVEPEVLLLDEPFSNIDSFRKGALRRNLFTYLKRKGITCIIATHDSIDALSFSDKTLVIKDGEIVQFDISKDVYQQPITKYVGSLFGEVNEIRIKDLIPTDESEDAILVYANELFLTEVSNLRAVVKQSFYKGNNYLIKAVIKRNILFFEHPKPIELNQEICLDVSKAIIELRRI